MESRDKKIGVRLSLATSPNLAETSFQRTVTRAVGADGADAARRSLLAEVEREYLRLRALCKVVLAVDGWREKRREEREYFAGKNVSLNIDLTVEEERLLVEFTAAYNAGDPSDGPAPIVHPVEFPLTGDMPPPDDVLATLDDEWRTLSRVLSIQQSGGTGRETLRVPPAFVQASSDSGELVAHPATSEEGRDATQRYLDRFRFPFDVEEDGRVYSFVPGVDVTGDGESVRLMMTLMAPAQGSRAPRTTTREVTVPLAEIYVQKGELNRKTQEGILELVKGLCRGLGREEGLASEIDISRPR